MKVLVCTGGGAGGEASAVAAEIAQQLQARQGGAIISSAGELGVISSVVVNSDDTAGRSYGEADGDIDPALLLTGIDELVHVPCAGEGEGDEWLGAATRSTFNLLTAAVAAGVRRVTLLTSMDSFLAYPANAAVG
eukprot:SAG22_NODE_8077_length_685_cov_1.232082_1_plen_134_part_10